MSGSLTNVRKGDNATYAKYGKSDGGSTTTRRLSFNWSMVQGLRGSIRIGTTNSNEAIWFSRTMIPNRYGSINAEAASDGDVESRI